MAERWCSGLKKKERKKGRRVFPGQDPCHRTGSGFQAALFIFVFHTPLRPCDTCTNQRSAWVLLFSGKNTRFLRNFVLGQLAAIQKSVRPPIVAANVLTFPPFYWFTPRIILSEAGQLILVALALASP